MTSYMPNTKIFLNAIWRRIREDEDDENAVDLELSTIESDFMLDVARENLQALEDRNGSDRELPVRFNALDLIEDRLAAYFKKRIREDALLRTLGPRVHWTAMVHFFSRMFDEFPGLVNGTDAVNGGELVQFVNQMLGQLPQLAIVRAWPEWEEYFSDLDTL